MQAPGPQPQERRSPPSLRESRLVHALAYADWGHAAPVVEALLQCPAGEQARWPRQLAALTALLTEEAGGAELGTPAVRWARQRQVDEEEEADAVRLAALTAEGGHVAAVLYLARYLAPAPLQQALYRLAAATGCRPAAAAALPLLAAQGTGTAALLQALRSGRADLVQDAVEVLGPHVAAYALRSVPEGAPWQERAIAMLVDAGAPTAGALTAAVHAEAPRAVKALLAAGADASDWSALVEAEWGAPEDQEQVQQQSSAAAGAPPLPARVLAALLTKPRLRRSEVALLARLRTPGLWAARMPMVAFRERSRVARRVQEGGSAAMARSTHGAARLARHARLGGMQAPSGTPLWGGPPSTSVGGHKRPASSRGDGGGGNGGSSSGASAAASGGGASSTAPLPSAVSPSKRQRQGGM